MSPSIDEVLRIVLDLSGADRVILQTVKPKGFSVFKVSGNLMYTVENILEVSKPGVISYKKWESIPLDVHSFNKEIYTLVTQGEHHSSKEDDLKNSAYRSLYKKMGLEKISAYLIKDYYFLAFHYYSKNDKKMGSSDIEDIREMMKKVI